MKRPLLCIALLFLFVAGTVPATSEAKSFRAESHITAVSPHSITVVLGHAQRSYKITGQTEIHVNGRKAGAQELKKGMQADVTASQIDPNVAIKIEAVSRS
jgi:hypothetical protein